MLENFQVKDSREMLNIWDLKYNKHNKLLQEQRQQQQPPSSPPVLIIPSNILPFVLMFLYCFILTSAEDTFASKTPTNDKLDSSRISVNETVIETRINNVNMLGKRDVANVPDVTDYNYDDEDDEYQIIKNKSGE